MTKENVATDGPSSSIPAPAPTTMHGPGGYRTVKFPKAPVTPEEFEVLASNYFAAWFPMGSKTARRHLIELVAAETDMLEEKPEGERDEVRFDRDLSILAKLSRMPEDVARRILDELQRLAGAGARTGGRDAAVRECLERIYPWNPLAPNPITEAVLAKYGPTVCGAAPMPGHGRAYLGKIAGADLSGISLDIYRVLTGLDCQGMHNWLDDPADEISFRLAWEMMHIEGLAKWNDEFDVPNFRPEWGFERRCIDGANVGVFDRQLYAAAVEATAGLDGRQGLTLLLAIEAHRSTRERAGVEVSDNVAKIFEQMQAGDLAGWL